MTTSQYNFVLDEAEDFLKEISYNNNKLEINNSLFEKNIRDKLLKKLNIIKKYYNNTVKNSHEVEVKNIIKTLKNCQEIKDFDEKLICCMIIAHEKIYKQTPRVIQIICLLYYLEGCKEGFNLIQEVLTGEGKTLTISFLALYLAIIGNKVDILTSSPVLAERDSKDRKKFYNYFGISCDFCRFDSKKDISGNNSKSFDCYKADIVYGDSTNLIGDILRTEFMGEKGRGDRPFDYIIIDEIDNICIDNLRNIVELVDNFPGYKYLEYLYLFIYKSLMKKVNIIKENSGNDFEKKLKEESESILADINRETRKFLYFNKLLKFDDKNKILIPENFYVFIDSRLEHWCKMAFDAMFNFKLNQNYFISNDKGSGFKTIKPIDYENTGVILIDSIWSGLHQFLQIKEGLTFTEENINSSFMSYLSYFKKYKRINGITGTLGTKRCQLAMKIIYKINLIKIPPFKFRKSLQVFEAKNFSDENIYKENLINEIIEYSAHHKRVVLVIFEYMSQVVEMHKYLEQHKVEFKLENTEIISYFRSDIENKFLEKPMKPNTIILSTNLSGRGTDIKINSEVKKNGGLHVIITFMPYNERTELQAQGRAARCGDEGSSITMLLSNNSYEILAERRDQYELANFKFLINLYAPHSDLIQKFFDEFCQRFHQIKNNKNIPNNIITDLKERWSMFILLNNINSKMNDSINEDCAGQFKELYQRITTRNFNNLMKEIKIDNIKDYKFFNPFNQLKSNLSNKLYQNAIESNPAFSIGAYYNQAYYIIRNQKEDEIKNYQVLVYNNFKTLKIICQKFIQQYEECMKMFNEIHEKDENKNYDNDFIKQFTNKKIIMNYYLNNVERNLNEIEKYSDNLIFEDNKNKSNFLSQNIKKFKYLNIRIIEEFAINIIKDELEVPQSAIDYFKDFGIEFFFEIECIEENCLIF